ncbi:MAG: hypothetical protein KA146_07810 [Leptospiraceae bacterium]|nr:hypothetical protein [Leptospiraceae bacterium]
MPSKILILFLFFLLQASCLLRDNGSLPELLILRELGKKVVGVITGTDNTTNPPISTPPTNTPVGNTPTTPPSTTDDCTSTAPSDPIGILVTTSTSPNKISITWTNPSNCKLKGILIKRKVGSIPADINDGTDITANSDNASLDDTSVSTATLYYYKIFLYNDSNQYSTGSIASGMLGTTTVIQTRVTDSSIVIDGLDNETAWSSTPKISFSFPVVPTFADYTGGADLNVTGYIRFAYDTNNFYIFYHTDDKFLRVDSAGNPWLNDGIEVFFDMGFNRTTTTDANDYHIVSAPLSGVSYENYGKGGPGWLAWSQSVTRSNYTTGSTLNNDADTDAGWNMEMKIPFTDLGISEITAGQVIGFTLWINDDDLVAGTATQHYFRWTTGASSTNPSTWGILQF